MTNKRLTDAYWKVNDILKQAVQQALDENDIDKANNIADASWELYHAIYDDKNELDNLYTAVELLAIHKALI